MPNSNLELLKQVAKRLGPLLPEVVFVGGCTTGLFITDEAAAEVRPTFDVDVIAEITSYADYATFSERLRALGFQEDTRRGAPLCRWLIEEMKLDVMPIEEKILGFSNRWYPAAMTRRGKRRLKWVSAFVLSPRPISLRQNWRPFAGAERATTRTATIWRTF